MKKLWKAFITNLSKLGRAMLVPIVAMPAIGILGRLGAADMLNIPLMETASNAITNNLDMLFALHRLTRAHSPLSCAMDK